MNTVTSAHRGADLHELRRGAAAMSTLMVGIAPLGILVGASASEHVSTVNGLVAAWAIFGASAHLAANELLGAGVGVGAVVLAGLLINARLLAYSASMAPHWKHESTRFKAVAAAALVEPTFALGGARYAAEGTTAQKRSYYAGGAVVLWFGWLAAVAVGATVGVNLPDIAAMALFVPLSLVALVAPGLLERGTAVAVATAVVVVIVAGTASTEASLLLATVAGAIAGAAAERSQR